MSYDETTKTYSWTTMTEEKKAWGPGPWDDEPDKVLWVDPSTGYTCVIRRGPFGSLCGYVGVPEKHPWYGKDYDDVSVSVSVDVHGGLTYSNSEDHAQNLNTGPGTTIWLDDRAGKWSKLWWVGFDCGHYMDISPRMEAITPMPLHSGLDTRIYRTVAYVREECAWLAWQAHEAACGRIIEAIFRSEDE